jgi:L-threonylcarbamoyladenylate synthase
MKIISLSDADIPDIVRQLQSGKTCVYPTETCYGIGCDATNAGAVERIFVMKKRQKDKPVLMIMSDIAMAKEYVVWTPHVQTLAQRYWPGPLTIVAQAAQQTVLAAGTCAEDGSVAFRVTDHPFASALATALGAPLVSTSANIASMKSPYDVASVTDAFAQSSVQPDIIIDAGPLTEHAPSTVVSVIDGRVNVLRQGEIVLQTQ